MTERGVDRAQSILALPGRRPDWDTYFLGIAYAVSARADCTRRRVGAVLVKDKRIVGTGYNGAPAGDPGCASDGACPRAQSNVAAFSSYDTGPGTCIAVHAEANALLYTDRADIVGSTLYETCEPCQGCLRLIRAAGVLRVVWPGGEL